MESRQIHRQGHLRHAERLRLLRSQPVKVGLLFGLAVGYTYANGTGHASDWLLFWHWVGGNPPAGVWNPDWAKLPLLPFAYLPAEAGHLALNLLTVFVVPPWSLLPKPVHAGMWYGNLDILVFLGLLLARSKAPYLGGLGLFLMSIKPQFFPLTLYHLRDPRRLVIPLSLFLLSLVIFGNWLPAWLSLLPPEPDFRVSVSLYPWSLPLWGLLFTAKDKELFTLSATALTMPYFNSLSILLLFAFSLPWWLMVTTIILTWFNCGTALLVLVLVYSLGVVK